MTNTPPEDSPIYEFLARYEAAGRGDDLDVLRELFAPSLVAGGPGGTATVTVDMVIAAAAARRERLAPLGDQGARLTSVEVTWLGPSYCLAVTGWELTFAPPGREPVVVAADSDFVLHVGTAGPRIVTYLARQDLDAAVARALA
jgi:hypothetical protein